MRRASKKPVVLYVEDEDSDVLLLKLAFEIAGVGFELKTVTDGEKAIEYLAGAGAFRDRTRFPLPDLVLLDLNLPRESGFEVLQWIRQRRSFESLPVIVYTSSLNAEDCARARALGANDYLEKLSDVKEIATFARDFSRRWLVC